MGHLDARSQSQVKRTLQAASDLCHQLRHVDQDAAEIRVTRSNSHKIRFLRLQELSAVMSNELLLRRLLYSAEGLI